MYYKRNCVSLFSNHISLFCIVNVHSSSVKHCFSQTTECLQQKNLTQISLRFTLRAQQNNPMSEPKTNMTF